MLLASCRKCPVKCALLSVPTPIRWPCFRPCSHRPLMQGFVGGNPREFISHTSLTLKYAEFISTSFGLWNTMKYELWWNTSLRKYELGWNTSLRYALHVSREGVGVRPSSHFDSHVSVSYCRVYWFFFLTRDCSNFIVTLLKTWWQTVINQLIIMHCSRHRQTETDA
jgi:hypothetical protein